MLVRTVQGDEPKRWRRSKRVLPYTPGVAETVEPRREEEVASAERATSRRGGIQQAWELTRGILRRASSHRIADESAKIAYFFFLSLFPLILILFALAGILGGGAAFDWVMVQFQTIMPAEAAQYLGRFVQDVTHVERLDVLSFSLLFLLIAASSAVGSMVTGLNLIFGIDESRPWWRRNLLAVGTTLLSALFVLLAVSWVLAGPETLEQLGLGWIWVRFYWPLVYSLGATLVWLAYLFLPNYRRRPALPALVVGALVATFLWASVTQGLRFYLASFERYASLYGFVTGILVMLIWLYLTAFAILFGGEVAATLALRARGED